ncbi:MAG: phosphotransferase [Acidobacteriia bacterium]|nr:phosphotransferase [Terriglobia bacterium]
MQRIVHTAFPGCRVAAAQPLADGLRNANFKLHLDSAGGVAVLRIYQHDASLCQKELDLMRLVAGSVPVPEVIHAEPRGLDDVPPFVLMSYVEGISFRELKRGGDSDAIAQAAYSAGATLAALGRAIFERSGWLGPGPAVGAPLLAGADPMPRFVDRCLESADLAGRVPAELRRAIHSLVWSFAPELAHASDEARLVHGDFNKRNLLVKLIAGRWQVAAVLDWEFAISGSPLADVANFLRYERARRPLAEPHFSNGFLEGGGTLPREWRRFSRVIDLIALCESLTRDELPDDVAVDLMELVRATIEDRDLRL